MTFEEKADRLRGGRLLGFEDTELELMRKPERFFEPEYLDDSLFWFGLNLSFWLERMMRRGRPPWRAPRCS